MLAATFHPWSLEPDPEWIVALVLFAASYLWAAFVFGASLRRRLSFVAGVLLVAAALLSPIEHVALHSMLSFHLLQNVMLADWAPPLLVLGLSPAMAAAALRHRALRLATTPAVALGYWLAVWYVVHVPAVYGYGLHHYWMLGVEHLAFLSAGTLFWWPVLVEGRMAPLPKLVYLAAAFFIAAPVALAIALSGSTLYPFYDTTPHLFGRSPLDDQQLGGMLMAVEQSALLFVAFSWTFFRLLSEDEQAPEAVGSV
ncbi:MAG: putative rane protein [Gaiellales bacterium]|nr:putative rane protein [Gaiellales bacterium]